MLTERHANQQRVNAVDSGLEGNFPHDTKCDQDSDTEFYLFVLIR